MRIAVVIEKFDPAGGGAERSTAQIVGELARRGHVVTVLTATAGGDAIGGREDAELQKGIALKTPAGDAYTLRCAGIRRLDGAGMKNFAAWAQRQQCDGGFDTGLSVTTAVPAPVVQPRSGTIRETLERNIAMRGSGPARLIKRLLIALTPKQHALLGLEKQTLSSLVSGRGDGGVRVRKIAAVSDYVTRQLKQHYGVDASFVEVIPNAAEVPAVSPQQRQQWRDDIRASFEVPADEPVFLFAALNPKLKGAPTLLKAAALLKSRGHAFTVLLAGETSWWLQSTCDRLGVRDRVRLLGPTREMPRLYCAADVTVLPSFYDPSSKVIIESLMLGVPGISTVFNGASDFLRATATTGARGVVIGDPGDERELAAAMESLLDPARRAACAKACEGLAEQLSMRRHVDRLEALLQRTAEAARRGE